MAMTEKMNRFVDEYLVDFNATQAAIRSGYSQQTAYAIGHENLSKPEIKAAINVRLAELSLSAQETTKLLADIAKGSINDYMKTRMVEFTPKIEISLEEHIKQLKEEVEFEEEYAAAAGLVGDALSSHISAQEHRKKNIIRRELELKKSPDAKVIVSGPTKLAERAELDLLALSKDKNRRIKSFKIKEFGPEIELYAADAALRDFARIHGLFKADNEQVKPDSDIDFSKMTDEELDEFYKKMKGEKPE